RRGAQRYLRGAAHRRRPRGGGRARAARRGGPCARQRGGPLLRRLHDGQLAGPPAGRVRGRHRAQ
ncbi:hypothetical protein MNEG_16331, partial [Monoraphidium neglectum]